MHMRKSTMQNLPKYEFYQHIVESFAKKMIRLSVTSNDTNVRLPKLTKRKKKVETKQSFIRLI